MDNVKIKKSNLEAANKQADDNTKKLLATLFGDAAMAVVLAAFGHRQWPFHGLDDLDQGDFSGVAA